VIRSDRRRQLKVTRIPGLRKEPAGVFDVAHGDPSIACTAAEDRLRLAESAVAPGPDVAWGQARGPAAGTQSAQHASLGGGAELGRRRLERHEPRRAPVVGSKSAHRLSQIAAAGEG